MTLEQIRKYGRTCQAITKAIRLCTKQDILREYLERRKKGVVDIYATLFDQDQVMEDYIASLRKEILEEIMEEADERISKESERKGSVQKHYLLELQSTDDRMQIRIDTSGGAVSFDVQVLKTQQYTIDEIFDAGVRKGEARGKALGETRGIAIGETRGETRKSERTAIRLYARGDAPTDIADILEVDIRQVQQWILPNKG